MTPLRTRIYIDGFNFYYGCLKGTPYKWLDFYPLFEKHIIPSILIHDNNGNAISSVLLEESSIKLFTADIIEKVAKSSDSVSSQAKYYKALKETNKSRIEIIKGYYAVNEMKVKVINPKSPKLWPNKCTEVKAWKVEEKQTDVNLALQIYHDAISNNVDHVIIVTNDTDIEPSLKMVRENTSVKIGLVIPTIDDQRPPSKGLTALADWTRNPTQDELLACQLPRVVRGARRVTSKPISWYRDPIQLQEIINLSLPVFNNNKSSVFKWLETENKFIDNKKPIELIDTHEGAIKVIKYIKKYLKDNNL